MNNHKNALNAIHVVSKNNTVYIKSSNNCSEWYAINFQWIPVNKLEETLNH
ncbi:hypothetical protein [Cognatitamlana onchidii]|uniref:hypothetical protein n=1 Tax=Cognatitamlana onchidii TaxID=2562860 RepID=UPI001455FC09|nr:hypothetical protein [Algibacter onchidii]